MDADKTKPENGDKTIQVHVRHIGELENANFKARETSTLQDIWTSSYGEFEPAITQHARDTFQGIEGGTVTDLMPHLNLTLAQAEAAGLTKTRHFQIAANTGGA